MATATPTGRFPDNRRTTHEHACGLPASICIIRPQPSEVLVTSDQFRVVSIDLLTSRTGQNRQEHRTDRYETSTLVIRRGQPFQMWIELSRAFNAKSDKIHLELTLGNQPMVSRGTLVTIPLVDKLEKKTWEAKILEQKDKKVKLTVFTPPTAPIGRYRLSVKTWTQEGSNTSSNPEETLFLLFNPWCVDDSVYMENQEHRKEYVQNDVGILYFGTDTQIGSRYWTFGQFASGILEACMLLLDKSQSLPSGRGDPVNVVRLVSAMVNSPDDGGVVEGNWSGNYSFGTSPSLWTGSVDILTQYLNSGGRPVRFGQCWVFSGVTTTVLRSLGIPTRSVTNFNSAHDTDVSLTTDTYFDENMRPIENLNNDSIWNFHVWNESWMSRPELPDGMGGWQVVDATPQETSQGMFRCGPASVAAIRNGLVNLKYDAPFVFSEVNSDRIFWKRNKNGSFTQVDCDKNVVGHCISTKAVGSDKREDITHLYKHPEGSDAERIAVETACRYGSKPNIYPAPAASDVVLQVTVKGEGAMIGEDAQLVFTVTNSSSVARSVVLYCNVAVMYYTGVLKGTVKNEDVSVKLKPKEEKKLNWIIPFEKYKDQLADQGAMVLTVLGRVTETKQVLATRFTFRLRKPKITVTPVGDAVVGKEMSVKLIFKNPLPYVLNNVTIQVESLGLLNAKTISQGDVASLATITLMEKFTPYSPGPKKFLASLDCDQIKQVLGFADIVVKEK